MRRKIETRLGRKILLNIYWLISGYGERFWPPIFWTIVVLVASTLCYVYFGLLKFKDTTTLLDWTHLKEACLYSLKVMTLLKPSDLVPTGFYGDLLNVAQSIVGPLLIGLLALAVRQQLKR